MTFSRGHTLLAVERELVDLAAQPDHQHAAEIRMAGIAGERAVQNHHAVARGAHAAALAMDDRHEAVDAGIFRQKPAVGFVGDRMADGRRAIDTGDDADEVARAGAAVGAAIAHEGAPAVGFGGVLGLARRDHRKASAFEDQIVRMDMLAGRDVLCGAADRLRIFHHGFAGRDWLDRHLVPWVDRRHGNRAAGQSRADLDAAIGDRDIVGGRKKNDVCGVHGRLSWVNLGIRAH